MSNIDKQALREAAEKATSGPWKAFSDVGTGTYAIHTPRDKRCENIIKWAGFDCQKNAKANAEFIAAFNPKVAKALLDELEAKDRRIEEEIGRANREHHRGFMMACGHLKEHANVHYADAAEMEMAALRQRIAELRESNVGLAQESFERQQRIAELQSVNDELTKFPDQIVSYVARLGTSEIGGHTKNVIYRAAQKVKDSAAGIGKGE